MPTNSCGHQSTGRPVVWERACARVSRRVRPLCWLRELKAVLVVNFLFVWFSCWCECACGGGGVCVLRLLLARLAPVSCRVVSWWA